jgi:hypothetical protein
MQQSTELTLFMKIAPKSVITLVSLFLCFAARFSNAADGIPSWTNTFNNGNLNGDHKWSKHRNTLP